MESPSLSSPRGSFVAVRRLSHGSERSATGCHSSPAEVVTGSMAWIGRGLSCVCGVVHFLGFGNQLAFDPLPFHLQRLRCKCNFHALKFIPKIQEIGSLLVRRIRKHDSRVPELDKQLFGDHMPGTYQVSCDDGYPRLVKQPADIALTGKISQRCACFKKEELGGPGLEIILFVSRRLKEPHLMMRPGVKKSGTTDLIESTNRAAASTLFLISATTRGEWSRQLLTLFSSMNDGDQRSPGIIPLAVKDAFSIIQETPSREFLLRVSYMEIYNEVMIQKK